MRTLGDITNTTEPRLPAAMKHLDIRTMGSGPEHKQTATTAATCSKVGHRSHHTQRKYQHELTTKLTRSAIGKHRSAMQLNRNEQGTPGLAGRRAAFVAQASGAIARLKMMLGRPKGTNTRHMAGPTQQRVTTIIGTAVSRQHVPAPGTSGVQVINRASSMAELCACCAQVR